MTSTPTQGLDAGALKRLIQGMRRAEDHRNTPPNITALLGDAISALEAVQIAALPASSGGDEGRVLTDASLEARTLVAAFDNFWAFLKGEYGLKIAAEDQEDHNFYGVFDALEPYRALSALSKRTEGERKPYEFAGFGHDPIPTEQSSSPADVGEDGCVSGNRFGKRLELVFETEQQASAMLKELRP